MQAPQGQDQTDVTNTEYEELVNSTGYVTVAERQPKACGPTFPEQTGVIH
jgi:hypothetical protein